MVSKYLVNGLLNSDILYLCNTSFLYAYSSNTPASTSLAHCINGSGHVLDKAGMKTTASETQSNYSPATKLA